MQPEANKVLAVVASDIHASHTVPAARAETVAAWYGRVESYFRQVAEVTKRHTCPLLIAGDVCHSWNEPAELINFLIKQFERMYDGVYAVPGQHDLPNHDYDQLKRSAYYTLCASGAVINVAPDTIVKVEPHRGMQFHLYGYPWGFEPDYLVSQSPRGVLKVALIHKYVWNGVASHAAAESKDSIKTVHNKFSGFNTVVIGDNHTPWQYRHNAQSTQFFNCGAFIRRRSEEKKQRPRVGLLHEDGSIVSYPLNVTDDKFHEQAVKDVEPAGVDVEEYLDALKKMTEAKGDFIAAVKHAMKMQKNMPPTVRVEVERILKEVE